MVQISKNIFQQSTFSLCLSLSLSKPMTDHMSDKSQADYIISLILLNLLIMTVTRRRRSHPCHCERACGYSCHVLGWGTWSQNSDFSVLVLCESDATKCCQHQFAGLLAIASFWAQHTNLRAERAKGGWETRGVRSHSSIILEACFRNLSCHHHPLLTKLEENMTSQFAPKLTW